MNWYQVELDSLKLYKNGEEIDTSGAQVSASNSDYGYSPSGANDDDPSTYWSCRSTPMTCSLEFKLAAPVAIDSYSFVIMPESKSFAQCSTPVEWKFEVKTDGSAWTMLHHEENLTESAMGVRNTVGPYPVNAEDIEGLIAITTTTTTAPTT